MADRTAIRNAVEAATSSVAQFLGNLSERWRDESEYENIADYQKAIQSRLPAGFQVTKMKKRPFGFAFVTGIDGDTFQYEMFVSRGYVRWRGREARS